MGGGRQRPRRVLAGAMIVSVALHGLTVLAFIAVSQERQAALGASVTSESASIEVEVLADPRAGVVDAAEAEPVPEAEPIDEAEQQRDALREQAELPADPPAPQPPPPEAKRPPIPLLPPLPPGAAVLTPHLSTARVSAGTGAEGRDDGTTDIILGANTVPPRGDPAAQNIPPRYPLDAARRGQQGIVELRIMVGTDGSALSVDVAVSSGHALLDRAARDAVVKWRFHPGQENGMVMPTSIPWTFQFSLVDRQSEIR